MEDLRLDSLKVCVKEKKGGVLRVVATLLSETQTPEEWHAMEEWMERFYAQVTASNTRFCCVYDLQAMPNDPGGIERLCKTLQAKRDATRRLSVTTCIVAPPLLSVVAQMAVRAYAPSPDGTVYFPDTVRDAKRQCDDEIRRQDGATAKG